MIFDHGGNEVGRSQLEHEQILPSAGLGRARPDRDLGAHQRGDPVGPARRAAARPATSPRSASPTSARRPSSGTGSTGQPYYNAIVWQDTRTDRIASRARARRARRPDPRNAPASRRRRTSPAARSSGCSTTSTACARTPRAGDALFGTIDSWLIWNLTGGVDGGVHVTDVTNASRTMLMDLETLDWDDELLGLFDIPRAMLPRDPAVVRPGRLRRGREPGGVRRRAAHRRPRRPAGGHGRPGVLRARRGQEHLRHRQLHAAQHRRPSSCAASTAC